MELPTDTDEIHPNKYKTEIRSFPIEMRAKESIVPFSDVLTLAFRDVTP